MYAEYLKEFWYTSEVEEETKTITFLRSWWDKPVSFTQNEFISAIGLPICKDVVPLPPKETVKAGLIDIRGIIFSDLVHKLQNGKKNRELNICYTRFLSLIFEKLLGRNYISNDLTLVKPHTITAASFQKPLASEVPLTSYMLKVAKLSEEPEQSLIPPPGEVNTDDTADKSFSRASVQPVTQSNAPIDLKTKKKIIPPSSKPKSPYKVRVIFLKKQVAETQHVKFTVATADATKSLVASELAEERVNQPSATEVEKVLDQNVKEEVKDIGFVAMDEVTFEQIMDKVDSKTHGAQENVESSYDIELEINIIKSYQAATISGSLSIPGDDLASIYGFETQDSADHVSEEGTDTLHASAGKSAQSDPLGHLHAKLGILNTMIDQLESSISKKVVEDMRSSVPAIVADTLKSQLPGLLFDALKDTLPQLLKDSIKRSVSESISEELPQVEAQVQKNLHDQLPNILLKPMYKEFNAFNKLESQRFVLLQKEQCRSLHNKMNKSRTWFPSSKHQKSLKRLMLRGRSGRKITLNHLLKKKILNTLIKLRGSKTQGPPLLLLFRGRSAQVVPNAGQAPIVNEEKAMVLHTLEEDTSGKKEIDDEPPTKKLMFLIPSPTPLKSIMPEPPKVTEAYKITLDQFTEHLSKTTSSIFSPTPPREPTPSRNESKGKGIATEEPLKDIMYFMEEGGSAPKISSLKSFVTLEEPLSQEKVMA
ncbi:hypothetical protein Tco_0150318 [Tanacetum coccineum]